MVGQVRLNRPYKHSLRHIKPKFINFKRSTSALSVFTRSRKPAKSHRTFQTYVSDEPQCHTVVAILCYRTKIGFCQIGGDFQCYHHRQMRRLKTRSNFSYQPIAFTVPNLLSSLGWLFDPKYFSVMSNAYLRAQEYGLTLSLRTGIKNLPREIKRYTVASASPKCTYIFTPKAYELKRLWALSSSLVAPI